MKNLQVTTLCGDALVVVHYDERKREWYGERARDGAQTERYNDLKLLACDLRDLGQQESFWREPLLREPRTEAELEAFVATMRRAQGMAV